MRTTTLALALVTICGLAGRLAAATLTNSSFETVNAGNLDSNGYANQGVNPATNAIPGWTVPTNGGDNTIGQPFANNHPIPNGSRIAFIQGSGTISQTVTGLDPSKTYTVQYFVNERGQGSLGTPTTSTSVSLGGNTSALPLGSIVTTDLYQRVVSGPLTTSATGNLSINAIGGNGDNSLLIDAVSISRAVPVVANGGFETTSVLGGNNFTSGVPTAWGGSGGLLTIHNGSGYGAQSTEGSQVAGIQGAGNLTQTINGFELGKEYSLSYEVGIRSNFGHEASTLNVSLGGNQISGPLTVDSTTFTPDPGSSMMLVTSSVFEALSTSMVLNFSGLGNAALNGGDNTLFIEDVHFNFVAETPEPSTLVLAGLGGLGLLIAARRAESIGQLCRRFHHK